MGIENLNEIWPEWNIVEQIGEGSFGKVYKAVREEHGFTDYAAIKVISIPNNRDDLNYLRVEGYDETSSRSYLETIITDVINEIKLMASLKGATNIVSVEDYKVVERTEEIGWDIYIRMELLTSLIEYTSDRKLSEDEVIKLGQDVCSALELCAKRNIIHRDVKPENIFVSSFGDFKLGDFGVARKLEEGNLTSMTTVGAFNYMAPEIRKAKKYGATVDVYSLGLVLYRLLNNNRLPFLDPKAQILSYQDRQNAINRRLSGERLPPPLQAGPQMAKVIIKACQYNPAMRFQTATKFKDDLEAVRKKKNPFMKKILNIAIISGITIACAVVLAFIIPLLLPVTVNPPSESSQSPEPVVPSPINTLEPPSTPVSTPPSTPEPTGSPGDAIDGAVVFECALFESEVRHYIRKPAGELILIADVETIKELRINDRDVTSLAGIEHFTELVSLHAAMNNISELDMSNNHKLQDLYVGDNQLSSLIVGNNPELVNLFCDNNKLTLLDVSGCPMLERLGASGKRLTSIDVTNNPALIYLSTMGSPITEIDVSKNKRLEVLDVYNNELTELDVSNNIRLKALIVSFNSLTELDLRNNPSIERLWVERNRMMTEADILGLDSLTFLDRNNQEMYRFHNQN